MAKPDKNAADDKKPMISNEYRKEYAKREPDWLKKFVTLQCYEDEKLPEGSKKTKIKKIANLGKMVKLAKVNNLDVSKFNTDAYNHGQKIMNINNVLRAAARKRFGLKDLSGAFIKIAPSDKLVEGHTKTHDENGAVIPTNQTKKGADSINKAA